MTFTLVCPSCERTIPTIAIRDGWAKVRGKIICPDCNVPFAGPPILTAIAGGRSS